MAGVFDYEIDRLFADGDRDFAAALPFAAHSFDTVLLHQVLHFAQDPARALLEAARVIRPAGRIAIVDFAAHDREELRDRHAHVRLGFADQTMADMLAEAGFAPAKPISLDEGALTVKIWLGTRRGTASANIARKLTS